MLKITITDGKITTGRDELGKSIQGLPNGTYFVSIHNEAAPIVEIETVIEWLQTLPPDYNDIQKTQHMMNRLAAAMYRHTAVIMDAHRDATRAEVMAEIEYVRRKKEMIDNGTGAQAASTAAKLETAALYEQKELFDTQKKVLEIELNATQQAFKAIYMMRAMLMNEKKDVDKTKGDSFPV